ncbi:pseudouridylate synthase 7 homolog [Ptychodera flava]|uniref:pseudouridylate synthase 7 homolog n=1 Tax=Ptychodera flava TaxID=63121 RepID=UPI00396AA263
MENKRTLEEASPASVPCLHAKKLRREAGETDDLPATGRSTRDRSLSTELPADDMVADNTVATTSSSKITGLLETDVGITEYIGQHHGFMGILKQRYSDFHVYEKSKDGHIVRLKNLSEPVDHSQEEEQSVPCDEFISEEDRHKLQELVDSEDKAGSVFIAITDDSKEVRTKIHQTIRQWYPSLESQTIEKDGKRAIKVVNSKNKGVKRKAKSRWSKDCPDYCSFVLYKENKDTMDALNLLARLLRIPHNVFSFAGNKDKRAITVQEVTAYRVSSSKLYSLNETLRNMRVGNFRYSKDALRLGDLEGNHFVIILRNVQADDSLIESAMTSLKDNGFINYYGMQRFGTTDIPTYQIGRALLLSKWQEAVDLILKPRDGEPDEMRAAREHWWQTRDAKSALEKMKNTKAFSLEYMLLRALIKHGSKDQLVKALYAIPKNTRLMYVHSYQSHVWNCMVSKKVKLHGLKVTVGDLVQSDDQKSDGKNSVVEITADNIDKFSIYDVLLPMPGYDVRYPANEVYEWYKHTLAEDDLDINSMKHDVRDYSLKGTYRKIVTMPTDCKWEIVRYDDLTVPLVLSDVDIIEGKRLQESPKDGKFKALKMEFTLPTSCYATMAIREVLKCDTSISFQSSLNSL